MKLRVRVMARLRVRVRGGEREAVGEGMDSHCGNCLGNPVGLGLACCVQQMQAQTGPDGSM